MLEPPVEGGESGVEPDDSFVGPSADVAAFLPDELEDERSFFAQPDPLKWIEGAEKALRTGAASQTGHAVGPSAVTPWITSNRWSLGQR